MRNSAALRSSLGLLLSLAAAGAVAAQQQAEPTVTRGTSGTLKTCISTTFTTSWTPYDDHTILVRSGSRVFKVTTNRCSGLTSPLPRIDTELKNGSSICSPYDVDLYVSSDGVGRIPCFVQSIQPLTADQAREMETAGRRKH